MTDVLAAEPPSKVKPLSPGATALVAILGAGYVLAEAALIGYPFTLQGQFCPEPVLTYGSMSWVILITGCMIPLTFAPILLVNAWGFRMHATGLPPPDHRRRRVMAGVQASGLLALTAVLSVSYTFSYYCVTPRNILLHPNPLRPAVALGWDDVKSVRAQCGITKSSFHYAELVLGLSSGFEITFPLGRPGNDTAIRTALAGQHYVYSTAESVRPEICPPKFYPLLRSLRG